MNAVGIFGGTFDPIHYGHLSAAWQVALALDSEVYMVPARQPPHRAQPGANPAQRWQLLEMALAGYPQLVADRRELDRSGPSYMVDTLLSFQQEFPDRGRCLILGLDALAGLHRWQRWEQLAELAHFIVLDRPGYPRPSEAPIAQFVAARETDCISHLARPHGGLVFFLPTPALEISASAIRKMLRAGQSAHFLLPPRCLGWIQREEIYSA